MPHSSPLVSIVMPFRNTAAYIHECIDSILNQTYTNWELHAVNDHSEDASNSLMNEFALKEPRIQLHQNIEKGIISALRVAYANSDGALITRMDSDDMMLPERIRLMQNSLLYKGSGHVAVGGVHYFSDRGISEGYKKYESWLNELTSRGDNYSEIYKECVIPSPCWMVYRKDFERAGGFESDRYPEDYDLTFRFYEAGLTPIPCREILHLWRDYDARTSRKHAHYAQNYFLDIKMHYFMKLHQVSDRPLTVWGAGYKGKVIAKTLIEKRVDFHWMCDNPRKIGKKIYGVPMLHFSEMDGLENPQCIITVANADAQQAIKQYLSDLGMISMKDYFFFC